MAAYPYDRDTRELVARLMYDVLPAFYRVQDHRPDGDGDLRRLVRLLAAPLAVVRQNIEELHADLFIDTSSDRAIGLLADMVGTTLVFPDAASNRLDVRGTVGWRRRKGTPSALEEMGLDLTGQLVVLMEGWKRVAMAQDLDLLRPERVIPNVRSPRLAEIGDGPLDDTHHAIDLRPITRRTGRYHPRHVTHWLHPTLMFPLADGTARYVGDHAEPIVAVTPGGTDPDWRYAVHPLGRYLPLRAQRMSSAERLRTDVVPPMHFAEAPGDWFDRPGRFSLLICGLPAGVAAPAAEARVPSALLAALDVGAGAAALALLAQTPLRWTTPVDVELCTVGVTGTPPLPDATTVEVRARITIDAAGAGPSVAVTTTPITGDRVIMLRLRAAGAASGAYFPGATVAATGGTRAAMRASSVPGLAQDGFLRGALAAEIPGGWVLGDRWYYLAADGSLASAQAAGAGVIDVPLVVTGVVRTIDATRTESVGPGSCWPPQRTTAVDEASRALPSGPGRGPVVLHGGRALAAASDTDVPATRALALVFAARFIVAGAASYRPFLRLAWQGPDPASATWTALQDNGSVVPVDQRFADMAAFRDGAPAQLALAVRLESDAAGVRLAPAELAWSDEGGATVLVHLPELLTAAPASPAAWPTAAAASADPLLVSVDGSTWSEAGTLARRAQRGAAPMRQHVLRRARQVRWRSLCPWQNEVAAGAKHAATPSGFLDVDVEHGLFALALAEPPQPWSVGPDGPPPPPNVTVDYQDGYTAHVGARPAAREPELDLEQPVPTRIVTRGGALADSGADSPSRVRRYRSLGAALADVAANPAAEEIVEIQDSATYPAEAVIFPAGCARLTIQAAERARPVLTFTSATAAPAALYDHLTLRGLAMLGAPVQLPRANEVFIQFCSVADATTTLALGAHPDGVEALVDRSLTAGIELAGGGTLTIRDSVVDGDLVDPGPDLHVPEGRLDLSNVTVRGRVHCHELEADAVIFDGEASVVNRFAGCVRYSRVPEGAILPRRHRVIEGTPIDYVTVDRHAPAHLRLAEMADRALLTGAEDGSEMGAFRSLQASRRREAFLRRLSEFTPAGLDTGLVRID